jgi:ubiquinone/menaquinone biosynthesis C-methylase UbiE
LIRGSNEIRDAYRNEKVAQSYVRDRFEQPLGALLHRSQVAVVREAILRQQARRVLEIAPGPARLTIDIAPALGAAGVTLMDASVQMLEEARRRLQAARSETCRFVQADAFGLPFRGPFDLVYTFRLIRHFELENRLRLYSQIAGVTQKGSLFVFDAVNETVSAPLRAARPEEYQHYDALLRPDAIRSEVERAGFELLSLQGVQHRFALLERLQVLVAPRSSGVARRAMSLVERYGGGEPLEWIVTCRRV